MARTEQATQAPTLRGLMRKALKPQVDVLELPTLAPLRQSRPWHPERDPSLPTLADLSGRPKVVLMVGPGGAGKTTAANLLCSRLDAEGLLLGNALVAATDPGVVGLAHFLPQGALHQPATRAAKDAEDLTRTVLLEAEGDEPPPVTILDAGGGSNALASVLERDRRVFARLEARGVAVIMLWHWTPRAHDLALLKAFADLGVRPTATGMVLNGAHARDSWDVYEGLRAQPVYQAALRDGAAEVWMPALQQEVALEVERKGLLFSYARHGKVPEWRHGLAPVDGDAATEIGLWMEDAGSEWAPITSWVRP